jgi:hypothetical protein
MSYDDNFLALANKYGIWLEQGRKRLVEWREANRTAGDDPEGCQARWTARDAMRAWTGALKRELEADLGAGIRARVNLAMNPNPLGANELAEAEARLAALDRLIGQLLGQAGPLTV